MSISVSNVSFQNIGRHKDVFDVTAGFMAEKQASTFKAVYVFIDLFRDLKWLPRKNPAINNVRDLCQLVKLAHSPSTFVKSWNELRHVVEDLSVEDSDENKLKTVRKANDCIGPSVEILELVDKTIRDVSQKVLSKARTVNAFSLTFGMGWNSYDNAVEIAKSDLNQLSGKAYEREFTRITGVLLKSGKDLSLLVLGVMLLLKIFTCYYAAYSITITAVNAASVAFTILEYYWQNLGAERVVKLA